MLRGAQYVIRQESEPDQQCLVVVWTAFTAPAFLHTQGRHIHTTKTASQLGCATTGLAMWRICTCTHSTSTSR